MKVVVSQPMFLPWPGLFEQIRLADVYVHYDDVQLPQGRSFVSRVQVKTAQGVQWLTAPIDHKASGEQINQTWLVGTHEWRNRHLQTLKHAYGRAPEFAKMYSLAQEIYAYKSDNVAAFNGNAIESISRWLGIQTRFEKSSLLGSPGHGTERLVSICKRLGGDVYITGMGALNYLNYELFEEKKISVEYMAYQRKAYAQLHGDFTPYVTILDAIAVLGADAVDILSSQSVYWKDFVDERK